MLWRKKKKKPEYTVDVTVTESDKPGINVVFSKKPVAHNSKPKASASSYRTSKHSTNELTQMIAHTKSSPFFPVKDSVLAQKVRDEIAASFANGETSGSLMQRLSKLLKDKREIEDIAYTEGVYVYSAAAVAYGVESGAIGKEWNATPLKDTCEDCKALSGKKVAIEAKFGQIDKLGHPPQHTGCRCGVRIMYSNESL
jgi:hypothetical protein